MQCILLSSHVTNCFHSRDPYVTHTVNFSHSINQQKAKRQVQQNRNHKAQSTLSENSYMFRHKFAIFREFNNNKVYEAHKLPGASTSHYIVYSTLYGAL